MKNKKIIILTGLIIFGIITILSTIIVYNQDMNTMKPYKNKPDLLNLYNLYINKFNYAHGLFLIPTGIFITFICLFLNLPTPKEAIKKFKKDLTKKIKRDLETFKKRGQ